MNVNVGNRMKKKPEQIYYVFVHTRDTWSRRLLRVLRNYDGLTIGTIHKNIVEKLIRDFWP